jgi:hypothetical protein
MFQWLTSDFDNTANVMYCVPGNGVLIRALKEAAVTLLVLEIGDHTL